MERNANIICNKEMREMDSEFHSKFKNFIADKGKSALSFFLTSFQVLLHRYGYYGNDVDDNIMVVELKSLDEASKNTSNNLQDELPIEISECVQGTLNFHGLWENNEEKIQKYFYSNTFESGIKQNLRGYITNNATGSGQSVMMSLKIIGDLEKGYKLQSIAEHNDPERFLQHFFKLVESICVDVNLSQQISAYDILSEKETREILLEWNSTEDSSYERLKGIHHIFKEQAIQYPTLPCVIFQSRKLTYSDIDKRSDSLACYIRHMNLVKRRGIIAVALSRSEHVIISVLSILKLDCVYVPVDLSNPESRLEFILEDSEPALIITDSIETEHFLSSIFQGKIIRITSEEVLDFSSHIDNRDEMLLDESEYCGESIAYIIYTSGSTGNPKGVCCTHKGLVNRICWMRDHYNVNSNDKVLHKTPVGFDVSLWELLLPLVSGASVIIAAPDSHKDSKAIMKLIIEESITLVHFVPSMLRAFLQSEESFDTCVSLRHVFASGEALTTDIAKLFYQKFITHVTLCNLYGPTEAAIDVSHFECRREDINSAGLTIPIGKPIVNTQLYILNDNFQPVPVMVPGELYIGGHGLAKEYLKRPELTSKHFVINPFGLYRLYRTGDVSMYRKDGNIEYLGRKDNQVKIRGFRIELGEIETTLMKIQGVANAAVIVRNDVVVNSKVLVGYVQRSVEVESSMEGEKNFIQRLKESLEKILPSYMIPSNFVILDSFPLTLSGKLDRKAFPKPSACRGSEKYDVLRPTSHMEKVMTKIWCEVMGVDGNSDGLSIRDNFFQLGGDSIICIQVRSRAKDYGIHMSVKDIFDYPTVESLSAVLERRCESSMSNANPIEAVIDHAFGEIPLTPVQLWFFDQKFENMNYWNQRVIIKQNGNILDENILLKSLEFLATLHSILNVRFSYTEEGMTNVIQNCRESATNAENNFVLKTLTINEEPLKNEGEKMKIMEEHQIERESSFNIKLGPSWGVTLFNFVDAYELDQRICFFAHHLIMDGVSLRVITTDLEKIYGCVLNDNRKELEEIRKTTSFRTCSLKMHSYANTMDLINDTTFFKSEIESIKEALLLSHEFQNSQSRTVQVFNNCLSKEITYDLLYKANTAYKTEINDILLTALAITISKWTGKDKIALELEGHGREEAIFGRDTSVDISRTVGWFTTMFPVCLKVDDLNNMENSLKMVKEHLRQIPYKGISYGILKYLKKVDWLCDVKEPEICFNYLGQIDNQIIAGSNWKILRLEDSISTDNHLHKSLIIDCAVCEGVLEISYRYKHPFECSTIQYIAEEFATQIKALVNHCCTENPFGYIPSDFPFMQRKLEQQTIDIHFGGIRGITDIFPLTPVQLGMYFLNCMDPQADNYIVQKIYKITGQVQVNLFEQAWQAVVKHFDSIRTGFYYGNGLEMPVQVVISPVKTNNIINYIDWSIHTECDHEILITRFIKEDRKKSFLLENHSLMRVSLVKLSNNDFTLLWTMHHIILDGWSAEIIFNSVFSVYEDLVEGKLNKIVCPSSFREHIIWMNAQNQNLEKTYTYFKNYLNEYSFKENFFPVNSLSTNNNQCNISQAKALVEFTFDSSSFTLSENVSRNLRQTASSHQVTLNTLIEMAWGTLIARYIQTDDVIFGLTVSGRSEQNNKDIVGLMINTLPIRIKFSTGGIQTHLSKLQVDTQQLEQFSYASLAEIQSLFAKQQGIESKRLFDTILVFENYPISNSNSKSLMAYCENTIENTEYPLTVAVTSNSKGEVNFKMIYQRQFFLPQMIDSISNGLQNVLAQIIESPDKSWDEYELMSKEDREEYAKTWNSNDVEFRNDLSAIYLIFEHMKKSPDSIAVIDKDRKFTYREMHKEVINLAMYIKSIIGATHGKIFGICLERSPELICCIITVMYLGGVYVPIDPLAPAERLDFILRDTEAVAFLTTKSLKKELSYEGKIMYLDEYSTQNDNNNEPDMVDTSFMKNVALCDTAYIIYTSGSTGKPKGVVVTHENLANYLLWSQMKYLGASVPGIIPLHSSIAFDLSITSIFLPLISGNTIVTVADSLGVAGLLDVLREYQTIRFLKITPSHLDIINEAFPEHGALPRINSLVIGGENLVSSKIQRWLVENPNVKIFNEYGPTECTVGCICYEVAQDFNFDLFHSVPVGQPIANTSIYILDKRMQLVPKYWLGELYVGGKGVTKGYRNLPEKTKESFVANPFGEGLLYKTGDCVRYGDNGILEYFGRSDLQIKVRGYRIDPGEVEYTLRSIQGIKEAVVVLVKGELNAFIVASYLIQSKSEIVSILEKKLPKYMIPSNLIFLDQLPIASSGKIDTVFLQNYKESAKLQPQSLSEDERNHNKLPPSLNNGYSEFTYFESQVASIWEEILNLEKGLGITGDNNFFQLGGHSLTALRFTNLTKSRLGVTLPLSKIFECPTVKELALCINKISSQIVSSQNSIPQCVITINSQGNKTPMFLIHSGFGLATEYYSLSGLDNDRPIFGINSNRFSMEASTHNSSRDRSESFQSITEMASHYISVVLSVKCQGPIIIGGWSFGGVVALEMARILRGKGKAVELVVLLDSFNNTKPDMVRGREDIETNFPNLSHDERNMIYLELESNCQLLAGHRVQVDLSEKVVLIKAAQSNGLVCCTEDEDTLNGWKGILSPVEIIKIPGSHYDMFRPEYVNYTIVAIKKALEMID